MVKIEVGPDKCRGTATGNVDTVAAELAMGIGAIYQSIKITEGDKAAEQFRMNLLIVLAPDCPAWDADDGMIVIRSAQKMSDTPTDQS